MHHLNKRHYYQCGDQTLSWQSDWYTQPWFTSSRQSYDQAASTGVVDPPLTIIETVPACSALLARSTPSSSTSYSSTASSSASTAQSSSRVISTTTGVTVQTSDGATFISTFTPDPTITTASPISSSSPSSLSSLPSSTASSAQSGGPSEVSSINACAGDWDFQGWGTIACLGVGVIFGGIIWLLWAILRDRIPALYSSRTWFVQNDARPLRLLAGITILLPFLHLPSLSSSSSVPLSEGHLSLHTMFAALKLAAISSLLALVVALPIIVAGVPCLSQTAPPNNLGGRLGTLTDLSLLRLLDALDPSPAIETSSSLFRLPVTVRDLPSTISPNISNARIRLIILLVIIAVLGCGGGLFVVARTYLAFTRYQRHFETEICGGLDMVIVPAEAAAASKGLPEAGVKKWLTQRFERTKSEGVGAFDVFGVFAIPKTSELRHKVDERGKVLLRLENSSLSSYDYARTPEPIGSPGLEQNPLVPRSTSDEPVPSSTLRGEHLGVTIASSQPPVSAAAQQSRFKEINRDSGFYGGRFPIGQRIKIDEKGEFIPDPSPGSEGEHILSLDEVSAGSHSAPPDPIQGDRSLLALTPEPTVPPSAGELDQVTGVSATEDIKGIARINPGPAKQPEILPTPAVVSSAHPSQEAVSVEGRNESHASSELSRFKELNKEIECLQREIFATVARGQAIAGWIIVGKAVGFLPYGERIHGLTREDVLWENVGKRTGEAAFWVKLFAIGALLAILMIPFIGLTVASAPGFAHYLHFLQPLARSDRFGTGLVQGLIPALALAALVGAALLSISRLATTVKTVSKSRQRILAYKATFYLSLFVTLLWPVTVAALEYAVKGFALDTQEARTTGDGVVYSTWFVFVLLLNLAIIVPGLQILRPIRLLRYWWTGRKTMTPRQRFRRRLPTSFNASYSLLPFMIAVFYASSLVFLFPLLAIPILVLLFLAMVANRYLVDFVLVERVGYTGSILGLWTIRRFGWCLGIQPALFGLILLSRREWGLGAAASAVAIVTVVLSEGLTVVRHPDSIRDRQGKLSKETRQALSLIEKELKQDPQSTEPDPSPRPRISDSSMLMRINTLLPGLSRLPPDCPLPLPSEDINDMFHTERAAYTRPDSRSLGRGDNGRGDEDYQQHEQARPGYFHDPTAAMRGLLYPPELLAPVPVIWLAHDGHGAAEAEVNELGTLHGLAAIVDPPIASRFSTSDDIGKGRAKEPARSSAEAGTPLLR